MQAVARSRNEKMLQARSAVCTNYQNGQRFLIIREADMEHLTGDNLNMTFGILVVLFFMTVARTPRRIKND